MASKLIILGSIAVFAFAVMYQVFLRDLVFVTFGVGRVHQHIEEFPYKCRRLRSPLLESCEDMILDTEGRKLYALCSSIASRKGWSPGANLYNVSARTLADHISVLDVDKSGSDGYYGLRRLKITGGYKSASGNKELDIHSADIEVLEDRLRFWMVNHRPPVDSAGDILQDATKVGANSTIEVFDHTRGSSKLEHVRTVSSESIISPNSLVRTGSGGVYITNDHNGKTGMFRDLEMLVGGGSVTYCDFDECHMAAPKIFSYANGIVKGREGHYYVANSASGKVFVLAPRSDNTLHKIQEISIGMPIDNLSVDSNGDIFVAAFPKVLAFVKAMDKPFTTDVPSTVFRIRLKRTEGMVRQFESEVTKVLEDIEGKVLPGATVAVHDAKTGNFWLGGVMSPYITLCEREGNNEA